MGTVGSAPGKVSIVFGFGKKVGPVLGLDINSSTISVIQLEKTKTDIKVARFSSMPTPPDVVREGLLADPEAAGIVVRELLDLVGIPDKKPVPSLNIGIPGQAVVIRLMPVPVGMPPDELGDVIRQEAINNLPFPVDEANLDYSLLPATERTDPDGVKRVDVILAAIQKNVVDSYWRMAETAHVNLGKLDISSLAVIRALAFSSMLSDETVMTMAVNIRNDATDITLIKKGMPLFSRSVLLGVETLGEAISRSVDAPMDEAINLLPHLQLGAIPTTDPKLGQAAQVARSVFGDLTAEVGRSLEFYMSQVGSVQVDQMILCGQGCIVPGVSDFIANRLNIRAAVADPFANVIYDRAQIVDERRPVHAMLLGLVADVNWCSLKTVEVDLNKSGPPPMPIEEGGGEEGEVEVEEVPTPWFIPALGVGIVACLVAAAVWAFFNCYLVPAKETELSEIENQITQTKQQVEAMSRQQKDIAELKQKKDVLERIVKHGTPRTAVLQAVRDNVPQGVQVWHVVVNGDKLTADCNTIDFARASHYAINLSGSNLLENAALSNVHRIQKNASVVGFGVNATVKPEASSAVVDLNQPLPSQASANPAGSGKPRVLDFFAKWCPPCQKMKPFMEEAERRYGDKVEFVAVDIDDPKNRELIEKYQVHSYPNVYFLDGRGDVVDHMVGFQGSPDPIYAALSKISNVASTGHTK